MSAGTRTAAILVGGAARRLDGTDKSRLIVGGRTILERQLGSLRGVVDRVILVTSRARAVSLDGVDVVEDRWPGGGSLGGICTALDAAGTDTLVLACDMPFLTPAFLSFLRDAGRGSEVVLPRTADGQHPLCARYAHTCAAAFRRRLDAGRLRVLDALEGLCVHDIGPDDLRRFDTAGVLLLNVNTPEDLTRAVEHARTLGA